MFQTTNQTIFKAESLPFFLDRQASCSIHWPARQRAEMRSSLRSSIQPWLAAKGEVQKNSWESSSAVILLILFVAMDGVSFCSLMFLFLFSFSFFPWFLVLLFLLLLLLLVAFVVSVVLHDVAAVVVGVVVGFACKTYMRCATANEQTAEKQRSS